MRLMMAVVVMIAGLFGMLFSGSDAENYTRVDAKVTKIERDCGITTTSTSYDGKKTVTADRGSCISVGEWKTIKSKPHSKRRLVDGKAKVIVSYRDPSDNSYQTGTLHFDGSDTEFYDYSFGDKITVFAHKEEPGKVRPF